MIWLIDAKFRTNKARYILQCALATVSSLLILFGLNVMSHAAVVASLGATSFIVFTAPHKNVSRPRYLVGGYVIGLVVGSFCHWVSQWPWLAQFAFIADHTYVIFGAMAVGLAIFMMVVTNTEHPPAAGVAMGLVFGEWQAMTVLVVLVGIVALVVIKRLLKPVLIDLL